MPCITSIIAKHIPNLSPYETLYKHFHSNPELSFVEHATAKRIHSELAKLPNLTIHDNIGGTGLAAVLHNGEGKTILLRADIDALPVHELTGLDYASTKRMADIDGVDQPVMHACGHDMHITSLLAAAALLHAAQDEWSGTAIFLFQPAEERGKGAQAMVDGGLYDKVLVPDVVLGAHVTPHRAGLVGAKVGNMMSTADSMKITVFGRGSHASQPHNSIDPVVLAAHIITRLQTLVSRETPPLETAVVTVASVRAGMAENVIPDHAELKLNVRTFNSNVRNNVLAGIKRIVQAECDASDSPKPPEYETISSFPKTVNDAELTDTLTKTMSAHFGDSWQTLGPLAGSEDFSILGTTVGKPCFYWIYGGTDPELLDRKEKEGSIDRDIPVNHSAYFAPIIQPTLKTGVESYAVAALTWLKSE